MDPVEHAREIERFLAKIVRGPGSSCWIWLGAIGDDGYGSFSIRRPAPDSARARRTGMREHVVSAPRYALAMALGVVLTESDVAEHEVCDEPICVRAHTGLVDGGVGHVSMSTQAANLATMGRRGRGGGAVRGWQRGGLDRAARVARSRALRSVVRVHGWDPVRMSEALAELAGSGQGRLF